MPPATKVRKVVNEEEENVPDGVIRHEFGKILELDEDDAYSPQIAVKEVPWRICLCKALREGEEYLLFYLFCMENKSQMWSIDVNSTCILVNCDISKNIKLDMKPTSFNYDGLGQGAQILKWSELVDEANGFIKDDKIVVEIHIWITKMTGIRTDGHFDFATASEPFHDKVLHIGDEKLHVCKEFLAIHSPVFKAMFYGAYDEKGKKEIPLKDVDAKDFQEMLQVLYPTGKKITDENVGIILQLADRFQIKLLIDSAEDFLLSSNKAKFALKLLLSDKFRLVKLQDRCLNDIMTPKQVKKLKKTPEYKELSETTKSALLERMIELADDSDED